MQDTASNVTMQDAMPDATTNNEARLLREARMLLADIVMDDPDWRASPALAEYSKYLAKDPKLAELLVKLAKLDSAVEQAVRDKKETERDAKM